MGCVSIKFKIGMEPKIEHHSFSIFEDKSNFKENILRIVIIALGFRGGKQGMMYR